jgi:hypothetical protein
MYGLDISITEVTGTPAAASARRESLMFCPVLTAHGSMMIASWGTPSAIACSA